MNQVQFSLSIKLKNDFISKKSILQDEKSENFGHTVVILSIWRKNLDCIFELFFRKIDKALDALLRENILDFIDMIFSIELIT